jgi:hypothetical protein
MNLTEETHADLAISQTGSFARCPLLISTPCPVVPRTSAGSHNCSIGDMTHHVLLLGEQWNFIDLQVNREISFLAWFSYLFNSLHLFPVCVMNHKSRYKHYLFLCPCEIRIMLNEAFYSLLYSLLLDTYWKRRWGEQNRKYISVQIWEVITTGMRRRNRMGKWILEK